MSFFDLFSSSQAPVSPTPDPVPAAPVVPEIKVPTAPESPLDQFKTLWDTDPNAKPEIAFSLNADPAKFMEAAKGMNFSSIIPAETLTAINAGGEGATKAFAEAMNTVAQATYAQSSHAAAKIVEMAVQKAEAAFEAKLPSLIKQHNVSDLNRTENPIFNHPSAMPIVGALEQQMSKKFPNATAQELRTMSQDYLKSFAEAISPKKASSTDSSNLAKGETDWDALLRI